MPDYSIKTALTGYDNGTCQTWKIEDVAYA
jgi:hypothetical protein